jgi:hypothetical protein
VNQLNVFSGIAPTALVQGSWLSAPTPDDPTAGGWTAPSLNLFELMVGHSFVDWHNP